MQIVTLGGNENERDKRENYNCHLTAGENNTSKNKIQIYVR